MSPKEIKRCYKNLLDSVEGNSGALIWATNLQSAWIEFVENFLKDVQERRLEK